MAAPQYIDYVMTYIQKTINDESIFPTKFGELIAANLANSLISIYADKEFPSSFEAIVKKIMRLLYHVIAHMYHSHFKEIVLLNLHPHLNCIFAHLVLFNERFKLIEEKELEVLHDLAIALKLYPPNSDCDISAQESIGSNDTNNNNSISPEYCGGVSVISTQCRSISAFDNYQNCHVNLSGEENLLDISEMKENASNTSLKKFNLNNPNNQNLTCVDMNMDTNYSCMNSPMIVDDNFEETSKKDALFANGSPEPMVVEPMTSSENIPKYTFDSINSLRGRSISANAVLSSSKTFEAFPTSPSTRRCNSDRTSARSNMNGQSTYGR